MFVTNEQHFVLSATIKTLNFEPRTFNLELSPMRWQTETHIPNFPFRVNHQSNLLLLGSCFAENIGGRLAYFKFRAAQNPFGIVYNPLSLLHNLRILGSTKMYSESDLHFANGRHFSFDHHSRFSAASAEETLQNINGQLAATREILPQTNVAFVSLGTAFYWWLIAENRVVNNCHKQPAKLFEQRRASVEQVRSALTETIMLLKNAAPNIHVVFTISPIRHLKHGSAGNQLSKAILMVAAQELAEGMENVHYFPSYELLLDDLRDYRWYEEDLIHPNKMAIDYIWEKFCGALMTDDALALLPKIDQLRQLLAHRPFDENPKALRALQAKISVLASGLPLDFSAEIMAWQKQHSLVA